VRHYRRDSYEVSYEPSFISVEYLSYSDLIFIDIGTTPNSDVIFFAPSNVGDHSPLP